MVSHAVRTRPKPSARFSAAGWPLNQTPSSAECTMSAPASASSNPT
jgi:hypothetical protein